MATIERYTTKAGETRYRVRYRKPDRRQTDKRGFTTKKAAEAFAATVEVQKLTGSYVSPTLGRIKVAELAEEWLDRKKADLKPSSYRPLEASWRNHVKPRWGSTRIMDVDLDSVEEWITDMGRTIIEADGAVTRKGSGATVVLRAYGVLVGILDMAVKKKRLPANPARTPDNLPTKKRKPRTYLDHGQVQALAIEAKYPTLVRTLAYTGLRWGETTALRVKDLDLPRKRASVVENAVQVGQDIVVGTPKNDEARQVPIPEFLVFELAALCKDKQPDDLVFTDDRGRRLSRPVSFTGWFAGAIDRAGIPTVTIHDLRHTAASLAISAGANPKALQRMLGHKSAAMTLDVYSDLFDDDLDAVGMALDQARSAASVGKMWAPDAQTKPTGHKKTS